MFEGDLYVSESDLYTFEGVLSMFCLCLKVIYVLSMFCLCLKVIYV